MQEVLRIDSLPDGALDAAGAFHERHMSEVRRLLTGQADALAILLPLAPRDHDDWRRALARDLGRAHAPKRVNIVGAGADKATCGLLEYLVDAPGVTGQYLAAHEQD